MKKVLILASGGLDSSVLIALYSALKYEVHTVYFNYGNKNVNMENTKLLALLKKYDVHGANAHFVPLSITWSNGGCIDQSNSNAYVEMRNLIFLSNAISIAEAYEIQEIAYGAIKIPDPYPDASEDFVERLDQLAMSTTGAHVVAPLINMTKQEVFDLALKLGIDLEETYSCNYPLTNGEPCGKCGDCIDISRLKNNLIK
jgi:7-cyano-7-deazaguanine synthase